MNVFSNTDGLAHQKLERTNMDIACLFVCKWTCYDRLAINNFLVYNKKYVFVNTDRNTQVGWTTSWQGEITSQLRIFVVVYVME